MPPWTTPRAGRDAASSGDRLAREAYARHGDELYRTALARLGDDAGAQDAVQETMVRAWRAAGTFDPAKGSLRTWLFAILRNVVHDQWASRGRQPVPVDPQDATDRAIHPADPHIRTPDPAERVVDTDLVTRALVLVSEDQRTAIVETYLRDRSYEEVAAELGVPVSTLRSRVFHGLRHLRTAMTTLEEDAR